MHQISLYPNKFYGVLPCDHFLNLMKNSQGKWNFGDCFIVNLSASGHSGSHFVAVHVTSKTTAEYFDSYAMSYDIDNNLTHAFDLAKLKIDANDKRIQDDASQFCGFYCVAFLLYRQANLSTETFMDVFDSINLKYNDVIVVELLKTLIDKNL